MEKSCSNCQYNKDFAPKIGSAACDTCYELNHWTAKQPMLFDHFTPEQVIDKRPDHVKTTEAKAQEIDARLSAEKSNVLPDSGERRQFSTGSVRDVRMNKGRYDLMSPYALFRYARRMEDGATKYGHRNWEKGQPLMSYLDSAMRHIWKYLWLCMTGQEHKEDHMGAALWNISSFIHTVEMIKLGQLPSELNDVPGGMVSYEDPNESKEI